MTVDFETVDVGDDLPPLTTAPITETQLVRYAGASGDFNPIHTVPHMAEQAGLGGVIAHGMLVMGLVGRGASGNKVKFSGGTYSAHPASMLAATGIVEGPIPRGSFLVAGRRTYLPDLLLEAFGKAPYVARGSPGGAAFPGPDPEQLPLSGLVAATSTRAFTPLGS